MRCISFGPGADADESSESQVLASGPTLDSLASFDAFAAVDAGAPEGTWGAPGSNVLEGTVDACDASDSDQAPKRMHLIHRSWHPGLSMADTIPDAGASDSDEANGSNASQVLALGPTFDS